MPTAIRSVHALPIGTKFWRPVVLKHDGDRTTLDLCTLTCTKAMDVAIQVAQINWVADVVSLQQCEVASHSPNGTLCVILQKRDPHRR